jgi:uracil-DNA glycosylase family 4
MAAKGHLCGGCPLEKLGAGFASGVKGSGPKMPLGVMIVAESLGQVEALRSDYLVGPTGQLLDRLIARTKHPITGASLSRAQFGLENTMHCQPPGDAVWGDGWGGKAAGIAALDHCRPYLEESLRQAQPRAILGLGTAALRFFTGLTKLDDKRTSMAGYIFDTPWGPYIPAWHPSHLQKGKMHLAEAWKLFLARAVLVAANGVQRRPLDYILYPSVDDAKRFVEEYKAAGCPPLSVDMETPYSNQKDEESKDEQDEDLETEAEGIDVNDPSYTILRTSFSWRPGYSITMPQVYPFTEVVRELLATQGVKIVWNGLAYDIPRFEVGGFTVNGEVWDGMLFFARLKPGYPKKLAAVAPLFTDLPEWKSESQSRPEYYSAVDADAALRCTLKIVEALKAKDMWAVTQRHITDLFSALRRVSRRGVNVDRPARKAAREDFEKRVIAAEAELQQHVPLSIRKTQVYNSRPSVFEKAAAKKGWDLTDGSWIKVQVEVPLKPGWEIGPDGEERKIPPPPKVKKVRVKKEKAVGSTAGNRNRRKSKVPEAVLGEAACEAQFTLDDCEWGSTGG